jgi:hypothetical protein
VGESEKRKKERKNVQIKKSENYKKGESTKERKIEIKNLEK